VTDPELSELNPNPPGFVVFPVSDHSGPHVFSPGNFAGGSCTCGWQVNNCSHDEAKERWHVDHAEMARKAWKAGHGASEVRTVSATGGEKGVKDLRYDLIPVFPLRELARLYGFGVKKYSDRNWEKGYEWSKSYAALQRHLNAFWGGEDFDAESGVPHLVNAAWHCFALVEWMQTHPEYDDRVRTTQK
jgi:hypothetical protein